MPSRNSQSPVVHSGAQITLFVVLPTEEVCTLRQLSFGVSVSEVKSRLELVAGLPAHVYKLVYPDNEIILDDSTLLTQGNIRDGFVLRVHLSDNWESLYQSIVKNNIEHVYHSEGVHVRDHLIMASQNATDKMDGVVRDRSSVALFMSSFHGSIKMTEMLLSVGEYQKC